jgi:hypothetical protein
MYRVVWCALCFVMISNVLYDFLFSLSFSPASGSIDCLIFGILSSCCSFLLHLLLIEHYRKDKTLKKAFIFSFIYIFLSSPVFFIGWKGGKGWSHR